MWFCTGSFVKFLVQCFEAYYPESLGILIIHKAPLVFWGVWKIIEPWLDPVVASKIRFTRGDKELTDVIEAERLPNKYEGGKDQVRKQKPLSMCWITFSLLFCL